MHREWPFFRSLLGNMDMVLAKTDIAIAARYAALVADTRARGTRSSRASTTSSAARVRRCSRSPASATFLEREPELARSIRDRLPYLDPLNHLQLELLRRHRAGDADRPSSGALHLTINGIAAGLRNSG